jgi:formiminoglutamase
MAIETPIWTATDGNLYYSRQDPSDPRLGEWVQPLDPAAPFPQDGATLILGYADDEGIQINGGRLGAAKAPPFLRKYLYRMTPSQEVSLKLYDLGDLTGKDCSLAQRHQQALNQARKAFSANHRVLSIGGGHDYGYSDGAGFLLSQSGSQLRPLILNFDAHLDVRPTDRGFSSGTPFYRLLSECHDFDFVEIGIQPQCNSLEHLKWLKDRGGKVLTLAEILQSSLAPAEKILNHLAPLLERPRPTFISIDIDVFSSTLAPGCSQSWPLGLTAADLYLSLGVLLKRLDVRGMGIYELSPPLDIADTTSKLAAQLAYQFLFANSL